jgi:hypothetical protein
MGGGASRPSPARGFFCDQLLVLRSHEASYWISETIDAENLHSLRAAWRVPGAGEPWRVFASMHRTLDGRFVDLQLVDTRQRRLAQVQVVDGSDLQGVYYVRGALVNATYHVSRRRVLDFAARLVHDQRHMHRICLEAEEAWPTLRLYELFAPLNRAEGLD